MNVCVYIKRIDLERASRIAMDPYLRGKPRLISDEELPAWLLKNEEEVSGLSYVENRMEFVA